MTRGSTFGPAHATPKAQCPPGMHPTETRLIAQHDRDITWKELAKSEQLAPLFDSQQSTPALVLAPPPEEGLSSTGQEPALFGGYVRSMLLQMLVDHLKVISTTLPLVVSAKQCNRSDGGRCWAAWVSGRVLTDPPPPPTSAVP